MAAKAWYKTVNKNQVVSNLTRDGQTGLVTNYTAIPTFNPTTYVYGAFDKSDVVDAFGSAGTDVSMNVGTVALQNGKYVVTSTNANFNKLKNLLGRSQLFRAVLCASVQAPAQDPAKMTEIQNFLNLHFGCLLQSTYVDSTIYSFNVGQIDVTTNYAYLFFGQLETSAYGSGYCNWCLPILVDDSGNLTWYKMIMTFAFGSSTITARIAIDNTLKAFPDYNPSPVNYASPYINITPSDEGGGDGSGDFNSEYIPRPNLPTLSAMGTGLIQLYNPTVSELSALGRWLWDSDGLDLDTLKRIFNDPMDTILGLSIFPVQPQVAPSTSAIQFGNITSSVQAKKITSQYFAVPGVSLYVPEVYGSYLDYAPYTKVQIYLPYIGIRELDTDEVMGRYVNIRYSIDLLSGACVAHIAVDQYKHSHGIHNYSLLYEFGGTCNTQIPLTGRDYSSVVQGIAGVVGTALMALGGVAGAAIGATEAAAAGAIGAASASGLAASLAAGARTVAGSKPTVEHASGIGGATGMLASQQAFLIIDRPNLCYPENQEHFTGYPGFIYMRVGDLSGYTKFVNLELTNIHATQTELEEIEDWFVNRGVRI